MEETDTVNTTAKVVWRRRQVVAGGRPRKNKGQREQKVREVAKSSVIGSDHRCVMVFQEHPKDQHCQASQCECH
jgi:hypothetical protein